MKSTDNNAADWMTFAGAAGEVATGGRHEPPGQSGAPVLRRGWRSSIRTNGLYRRSRGWTAIIKPNSNSYELVLRRDERCLEDGLAAANEIIVPPEEEIR